MSVWGDDLNGRDFNEKRDYGMTRTVPPVDYRWHHTKCNSGMGNDEVLSLTALTRATHRAMRLAWLDQFEMEITEEGAYRYWRWYDKERSCRWSERRPLSAPLPKRPGFWPSDE